jgi:hypothetical protein
MGSHVRRWTAILVLALLLTGCGERYETQTQTQSPVLQSAAPTTPVALGAAEAKARYLTIVEPYNVALEKLEDAANAGKPWRTVRALAGDVARTNAVHAVELRQTAWPEKVRAPVAALLAENAAALPHWRRAGEATSAEELMREIRSASAHSGAKEAGRVRAALGLPAYRES